MKYIKKEVRKFMEERNWLDQPLSNVAKSIVIESAELLEHFQWKNHTTNDIKADADKRDEILFELADIIIYCAEISILLDADMDKIVKRKLDKQRIKYPAELMKDNKLGSKKYNEIKKEYRQNKVK